MIKNTVAVLCLVSCLSSAVQAQTNMKLANPFTPAGYADKLFQYLDKPCRFEWDWHTTIDQVAKDLSVDLDIDIDHRALEDIGLTANETFGGRSTRAGGTRSRTTQDDPFISAMTNSTPAGTAKENALSGEAKAEKAPWWERSSGKSVNLKQIKTGARLMFLLNKLDLTLHLENGQLVITTIEQAEVSCIPAVYDVTGLSDSFADQGLASFGGNGDNDYDYQSLVDVIEVSVSPDSWESLGGASTIIPKSYSSRQHLIISTTLTVHWQVKTLLSAIRDK